jgi:hypothetical protein
MENESEIRARLQRMVAEDPNGREAKRLLDRLTIFLTEHFGLPAVNLMVERPLSTAKKQQLLTTLQKWEFLHKKRDNNPTYQIDPGVIDLFHPYPSDENRHFAIYAAHVLRHGMGVSKETLEIYLDLIG